MKYGKGYSTSALQRKYGLTYEQGHELAELILSWQKYFVEKLELEVKLKEAYEKLEDYSIKNNCLQEQLNEANEVITHYAEKNGYMKAIKYLNKWGVK